MKDWANNLRKRGVPASRIHPVVDMKKKVGVGRKPIRNDFLWLQHVVGYNPRATNAKYRRQRLNEYLQGSVARTHRIIPIVEKYRKEDANYLRRRLEKKFEKQRKKRDSRFSKGGR